MLDWEELTSLLKECEQQYLKTDEYLKGLLLGIKGEYYSFDLTNTTWEEYGVYSLCIDTSKKEVHIKVDLDYFSCVELRYSGIYKVTNLLFRNMDLLFSEDNMIVYYHVVDTKLAKQRHSSKFQYICTDSGGDTVDTVHVLFETDIVGGLHGFCLSGTYILHTALLNNFSNCTIETDNLETSIDAYNSLCDRNVIISTKNHYSLDFDLLSDKTIEELIRVYRYLKNLNRVNKEEKKRVTSALHFLFFEPGYMCLTETDINLWFAKVSNKLEKSIGKTDFRITITIYENNRYGYEMYRDNGIFTYFRMRMDLNKKAESYYFLS